MLIWLIIVIVAGASSLGWAEDDGHYISEFVSPYQMSKRYDQFCCYGLRDEANDSIIIIISDRIFLSDLLIKR